MERGRHIRGSRRSAVAAAWLLACLGCARPDGTMGPTGGALEPNPRPGEAYVVPFPEPWIPGCGRGCENAYLDFIARHGKPEARLSDGELSTLLAELAGAPMPKPLELDLAAMNRRTRRALSIELLIEGIEDRPLAVSALDEATSGGVVRRKLLFWDPEVGSFEGLLLLPAGPGPHPAVIGLHGHRDDHEEFSELYLGNELAEAGFAVLVPRFRAHDCSRAENEISAELLRNGFTLMGLRVYETLLMVKYLEHLESADENRLALVGHSGGGAVADLAVRVSDAFDALVTDHLVDLWRGCGPEGTHCENIPSLLPLSADIARPSWKVPFLHVRYNFNDPATREAILAFLESVLDNRNRPKGG